MESNVGVFMCLLNEIKWLANNASRDTSSGQFIPEIDGLRFIAVMSVFLSHLSGYVLNKTGQIQNVDPLASLLSRGDIGVQLFFIISGFVIALPYAKGNLFGSKIPSLKQFYIRRLTRLEPPYFANLLIVYMIVVLATSSKALDLLPNLFASMMYTHNIIFASMSAVNAVAWSLEVELQFYILAPLSTYLFKISQIYVRRGIIIGIIAIFSVINFMVGDLPLIYKLSMLYQVQFFFTGFLLLDVYLNEWQQNPIKSYTWDVVSVAAWATFVVVLYMGKSARAIIVLPMFIAYCAAFKGTSSNRFFRQHLIYTIGGMCYTIYLYHYTIIAAFGVLLIKSGIINNMPVWMALITSCIVLAPITLFLCTILFVFIEKPCMRRDWYIRFLKWKFFRAKAA